MLQPHRSLPSLTASILSVLVVLAAAWLAQPAHAEGGQAFSISPPLVELTADPGQTVETAISFTNISSSAMLVTAETNPFRAKNETGDPNILFDADGQDESFARWIVRPEPFHIQPGETKTVNFPIRVPANAEPGGHYAVIRFAGAVPGQASNGVALNASIGTLVLLRIVGDIQEHASLAEMFTATPHGQKAGFFESGPVLFVERIKNDGNVHLKPTGTLKIRGMFGTVATLRVNGEPANTADPPKSILPQSIRRFEQTLDKRWLFGPYTATLTLGYGQHGTIEKTVTFWVIPYRLVLVVLAGLVVLILVLRWAVKRYNAHIIRKAGGKVK